MQTGQETYPQQVSKEIEIHATPADIWAALTQPAQMQQWMAETPIEIDTGWQVGSSIIISGPWYKARFMNTGRILVYDPCRELSYTHLSSLSRLADEEENHTVLTFTLTPVNEGLTRLYFTARRFAASAIYHHLAFYWNVTLHKIKRHVEQGVPHY